MLKIIIGLLILFMVTCMATAFLEIMKEDLYFPKFMIILGQICWTVFGILLIILMSYIIGGIVLGGLT